MSRVAMMTSIPVSFFSLPTMKIPMLNRAQAAYAFPRMSRNADSQLGRLCALSPWPLKEGAIQEGRKENESSGTLHLWSFE